MPAVDQSPVQTPKVTSNLVADSGAKPSISTGGNVNTSGQGSGAVIPDGVKGWAGDHFFFLGFGRLGTAFGLGYLLWFRTSVLSWQSFWELKVESGLGKQNVGIV